MSSALLRFAAFSSSVRSRSSLRVDRAPVTSFNETSPMSSATRWSLSSGIINTAPSSGRMCSGIPAPVPGSFRHRPKKRVQPSRFDAERHASGSLFPVSSTGLRAYALARARGTCRLLPCLREPDRDRLLGILDGLSRPAGLELAAFEFMHHAGFDLFEASGPYFRFSRAFVALLFMIDVHPIRSAEVEPWGDSSLGRGQFGRWRRLGEACRAVVLTTG